MSSLINLDKGPESTQPIYAGRCAGRRDVIALVAISASRSGTEWTPVRNAHKLFPKTGVVEIRGAETKSLRENDWVALQIAPNKGNIQVHYKGAHHWRLFNFIDLSNLGSDRVRSTLKIDGLPASGHSGTWFIRTGQYEILKAELVRSGSVMRLASNTGPLPVYPFDAQNLFEMPDAEGHVQLYDFPPETAAISVRDWASDEEYISRVLKALPAAYDGRVEALLKSLFGHPTSNAGQVCSNAEDLLSAHEALRSGALAKDLLANRERLRELAEALQASPAVSRLIESQIAEIAVRDRASIQARLDRKLQQEIKVQREKGLNELEQVLRASEKTRKAELELSIRNDELAQQQALASRRADDERKLDQELAEFRAKHESAIVAEVEHRKDEMQIEVDRLAQQSASLAESIAVLKDEQSHLDGTICSLHESVSAAQHQLDEIENRKSRMIADAPTRLARSITPSTTLDRAIPLACKDVRQAIYKCALLTREGKRLMEHFLTLMLAADLPILTGPQVSEFLHIAEVMFSSGSSASLVADPTIICVDDLWMRAGLRIPTSLGIAVDTHADDDAPCTLAVIEGADDSAARYWYPALAKQARRGELPRNVLLCVTVNDVDSDDALAIQRHGVVLDIKDAIDNGSPALAPMLLSPPFYRDLRPEPWIADLSTGAALVITSTEGLTITSSMRATRACLESLRLSDNDDSPAVPLISLFRN